MGWTTEDGLHEGYLVPQFVDGQRAAGVTGGGIPDDQVASGPEAQAADGTWSYPTRPAGEVTGWVICCDCRLSDAFRFTTWVGPVFTRVPSKALEDPKARRVYATDDDVVFVSDREDVHEVAYDLWRSEHAFGADALGEVEAAAQAAAAAKERLDVAVAIARASGETWEAIGRAAGMARQSAQGRWGPSTDAGSAGDR